MIKYYTSSSYRKHYSDLQKINMLSQTLDVDPLQLSLYVLRNNQKDKSNNSSKSPSKSAVKSLVIQDPQKCFIQLIEDLDIFKNLTMTPIKVFKSLLLIHCTFLLVKISPSQENVDKLNSYFKWVLEETVDMIQKYSHKESKKRTDSIDKKEGFFQKSVKSLRALSPGFPSNPKTNQRPKSTGKYPSQQVLSKQISLLSSIIKPYILYLQKILAIYSHYQNMMRSIPSTMQGSSESVWTVMNIFKLMTPIVSVFAFIGRYFYKEYSQIVYLLIEFFTKQVNRLYPILRVQVQKRTSKVEHEWFALLSKHSQFEILHNKQIQLKGADDTMLLIDEILKINDTLYIIYYGKHFYSIIQRLRIPIPRWLQLNSKDCEFLTHYAQMKNKVKRRSSSRSSKDKKPSSASILNLPSQIITQKSPRTYQNLGEKKIVLPKPKKVLKLDETQKDDAITFRMKQLHETSIRNNKILGDLSFSKGSSTEGSQNFEEISFKE